MSNTNDRDDFDHEGWAAWCSAGRELFRGTGASLHAARRLAAGVLAVLAMRRSGGKISRAAGAVGASRRTLRETLRAAGAYPWRPSANASKTD